MINVIESSLHEAKTALEQLLANGKTQSEIALAAELLIGSLSAGHRIFSCGNGGSMCDAMHFAEELTGRYRKDRRAYPAIAIADPSHMSCVANDFGYDYVFSRYLEAHGSPGDTLIAISTSGTSKNIMKAAEIANEMDIQVIVLSGKVEPSLQALSHVYICTPGGEFADHVQELHIKILHIFIELIERHFHPKNYQ